MSPSSAHARQARVVVNPWSAWYRPVKSLIDFVLALLLLVILAPVIVVAAILVRLTSSGPAFYLQTRVGKDGRLFKIIKLRSMRQDAEAATGAIWSTGTDDDRITPVGRILRMTHIDEFPQLVNVILGDMSLVGPRPERPEFVGKFELQIDHYTSRLLVRPGITGVAQLRLPPDSDLESVRRKLEFDLYYVRHLNLAMDALAMLLTAWQLVENLWGCLTPQWARIPSDDDVRADFGRYAQDRVRFRSGRLRFPAPPAGLNSRGRIPPRVGFFPSPEDA